MVRPGPVHLHVAVAAMRVELREVAVAAMRVELSEVPQCGSGHCIAVRYAFRCSPPPTDWQGIANPHIAIMACTVILIRVFCPPMRRLVPGLWMDGENA